MFFLYADVYMIMLYLSMFLCTFLVYVSLHIHIYAFLICMYYYHIYFSFRFTLCITKLFQYFYFSAKDEYENVIHEK